MRPRPLVRRRAGRRDRTHSVPASTERGRVRCEVDLDAQLDFAKLAGSRPKDANLQGTVLGGSYLVGATLPSRLTAAQLVVQSAFQRRPGAMYRAFKHGLQKPTERFRYRDRRSRSLTGPLVPPSGYGQRQGPLTSTAAARERGRVSFQAPRSVNADQASLEAARAFAR
jgi:hypothetical protein